MGAFKNMEIELQEKGVVPQTNYVTVLVHELNHSDPSIEYDIATYYIANTNRKLYWYIDPNFKIPATLADVKKHFAVKGYQQTLIKFALRGNKVARKILALLSEE